MAISISLQFSSVPPPVIRKNGPALFLELAKSSCLARVFGWVVTLAREAESPSLFCLIDCLAIVAFAYPSSRRVATAL